MTTEAAFLQSIRAAPADDTPRLVFADWLDDCGDSERAEFIRLQCELAHWIPDLDRRTALQRRERELLHAHERSWLGGIRRFCRSWRFERGLPSVTMPAKQFLSTEFAADAETLLAGVQEVRLLNAGSAAAELFQSPQLAAITALDLDGAGMGDIAVKHLVNSEFTRQLRTLNLANNFLTFLSVWSLCDSESMNGLRSLDLRNNRLGPFGVETIIETDSVRLPILELHGNVVGIVGWRPAGATLNRVVNSLGMELALIPAGTLRRGSSEAVVQRSEDEPMQTVTLTSAFYLGVYTVTQAQFATVMEQNPSRFTSDRGGGPFHPVDNVTWDEAVEFCFRLSDRAEERAAGRTYRLPTEAEWEHACRAGTTTAFHYGDTLTSHFANFDGNYPYGGKRGPFLNRTSVVGWYKPNAWGLFDMHGNVWEWCADWFKSDHYLHCSENDPIGPAHGQKRVLRGGGWFHGGTPCRSAYRFREGPDERNNYNGFRVAMDLSGA